MGNPVCRSASNVICRAFTLVELLVVIGIIALLISILLPSLNKARQQANAVACLSNMRSVGQGVALFTNEKRGWLPKYWTNSGPLPNDTSWGNAYPYLSWNYLLAKQIKNKAVFRCPADDSGQMYGLWTTSSWAGADAEEDDVPASYRWNQSNFPDSENSIRITKMKGASRVMLLCEGFSTAAYPEQFVATWSGSVDSGVGRLTLNNVAYNRHGGKSIREAKCNFLFADGHAATMTWNESWQQNGGTTAQPETMWRTLYLPSKYNNGSPLNNLNP